MENANRLESSNRDFKDELVIPLMVLTVLAGAWFVYIYESRIWITAFEQVVSWIVNPSINYTPVQIEGIPLAVLASIEVIILGASFTHILLPKDESTVVKAVSTLGLGFGLTGTVTIILGIFGNLYRTSLNALILLLGICFLSTIFYTQRKEKKQLSLKRFLKNSSSLKRLARVPHIGFWSLAYLAIGIIFSLCFYHALLTIVVHWDATVYHAVMSVVMYNSHSIPLIAGPSIGIEMSANFPPLFSALGAYYYIQIGAVEDFFLRIIPPIMGVLTVVATYKIGEVLAGKKFGLISALFLAMTPLFFRYSIYATSYSTLTFFCTVSILFLLYAIIKKGTRYWIACGLFYGIALLTSYMALYLAPFFVASLVYYFLKAKAPLKVNIERAFVLIFSASLIGGIWYLRNLILLGNPIYPNAYTILGGINIDPLIMETTINGIKSAGMACFFGGDVSVLQKTFMFIIYRTHFPAISLFTLLGIALLPFQDKKLWLISIWPITASVLILGGLTWAFPRHVVLALPGFAIISSLPIVKALEKCQEYDKNRGYCSEINMRTRKRLSSLHKSDIIRIGLMAVLFVAFLFPSLTLSFGGKLSMDNHLDQPPEDYLWLFKNPNSEKWFTLTTLFPEAIGWKWLDDHLEEGEKVATVENRIYYIKNSNNDYFFYLDGWEAKDLYNITDPGLMLQFLQKEKVKYILDVTSARTHGHFDILPLTLFLGSAYFPKILDCSGNPDIYKVGPVENPITTESPIIISMNQKGWSEPNQVEGVYTQAVIAKNDSSRLFVATPSLTRVNITYLDVGTDGLSINLFNPYAKDWICSYGVIEKKDTGKWKTYEFLPPLSQEGFVELAFHCNSENFTISRIEASQFQMLGKSTLDSLKSEITYTTDPPTLMAYLPIFRSNETMTVQTDSFGKKICVEIFEGLIQPWEATGWWKNHGLATRTPNSTTIGQVNPSLTWNATKSGLYTMVIVLRDAYSENTIIDLQISKGGTY